MECKTNRVRLRTGEVVDRHVHLERASNVRDMGGYATRFGRTVRRGRLYRAGELAKITDADLATLEALDLRLIYDLRTSIERERRPARSWGSQIRRLARDYRHSGADLPALAAAATPTAADMRDGMLALYRALPFDQAEAFKSIFQAAAAGELPLLFNCAGHLCVHRRSLSKAVYPGYWDAAAGGMVGAAESYAESAARELAEELGIRDVALAEHGRFFFDQPGNRLWCAVYSCVSDAPLSLQPEEVLEACFLATEQVLQDARQRPYCPDSLQALQRYLAHA